MTRLSAWLAAASWRPILPAVLVLSGCGSVLTVGTADVAGIAGAGAANAVTKSAAIATGIGLAVAAGANAGLEYAERRVHRYEQDRIAKVAGGLETARSATGASCTTSPSRMTSTARWW